MKLFNCENCGQILLFENTNCEKCGHRLGYLADKALLTALEPDGDTDWRTLSAPRRRVRLCENAQHDACNWLLDVDDPFTLCRACRHNQTIPDLSVADNVRRWRKVENAKRRLFYTLLRFGLPLHTRAEDPAHGLVFDFLADAPNSPRKVMTGHDEGLITIALAEADAAEREQRRTLMGEPYRALLGHMRHEIGHHYWDILVRDAGKLDACRAVFGDDSLDYDQALQAHYADGAPADWRENYISAYATTHPWEDFAETWAHYLHIVDTLETGSAFGLRIHAPIDKAGALDARLDFDPHDSVDVQQLVDAWIPLTFSVNTLNRSMGQPDLYPFLLTNGVIAKLQFVRDLIHGDVP